jgi:Uncharacterized protein conserved in bacteria (DUF2255)
MTTWSKDELRKIAEADDLHISPFREDGVTYGTPTWIWSVAGSMTPSTCAATTGRILVGTRQRCGRRPGGYVIVGSAAGALIGLEFVVVTLIA